jgi:hypothetical protein
MYGVELLQATETADAAAAPGVLVLNVEVAAETKQETCTVALTLNEALAVAASAGLTARHNASKPKARTGNVVFMVSALPTRGPTHDRSLIGSS